MKSVMQAAALAAAALVSIAPANAQTSNSLTGSASVMDKISASDVASMMTELGVTSQMLPQEGGSPVMLATTPSGGRFLFHFRGCADAAQAVGCANTVVTAALPSAGYSYDDLNDFNGSAVVSTAVAVSPQQVIVLGRNIIVLGGHSRELFKGTVYLFLVDVQKFVDMKQTANSVAFRPSPEKASKIGRLSAEPSPAGAESAFGLSDLSAETSAAIANTRDVAFSIDYRPEF